ncbi:hypothetical protein HC931_05550 [Candidatus Gracilibacteria bacterium]|nr:hypothetical protein [Candidatus Gracilibacteria bacterium]NJM90214.1 hypothetical protein [Hydrococcus sp. RU_2_2]
MLPITTYSQDKITLALVSEISDLLKNNDANFNDFIETLKKFNLNLEKNRDFYNINPYSDKLKLGIHILAKDGSELKIFPNANLALKCSEGNFFADNLKQQFERSIKLAIDFETKLNAKERELLKICPVYSYFKTYEKDVLFKQILFMQNIEGGKNLGDTKAGFDAEFCRVFQIPEFKEIAWKARFKLHFLLDKDRQRQLLKIQTAYLFRRLLTKGISILSLNQKNILISQTRNSEPIEYTIIDPTVDWFAPLSPIYNLGTYLFCQ